MKLEIRKYGDPVLRQKGARVEKITAEIKKLVAAMFETMYEARGVGLAAQQVGHALQLTIIDVRGIKDRPSTLHLGGQAVDPEAHMPLVLINPVIKSGGETFSFDSSFDFHFTRHICLHSLAVFRSFTGPMDLGSIASLFVYFVFRAPNPLKRKRDTKCYARSK